MDRIRGIRKLTDNRFLNLYSMDVTFRDGSQGTYYEASRRREVSQLRAVTHDSQPDGVVICGVWGEAQDRVVLIRQFRYPLNGYVYEFPAGLVEPGETLVSAGVREMYEETGLTLAPVDAGDYSRPFFTTVGMTDECCGMVFGRCAGQPTNSHQEGSEDIQVVLADRAECARILKEENVAIMCAYMLMHFVSGEGDPLKFLNH